MIDLRRRPTSLLAASCAVLVVVGASCYVGARGSFPPTDAAGAPPVAERSAVPSTGVSAPPELTGCGSSTLWIDYVPGLTTADLAAHGSDFVVADVVGFDPSIFNTPDGRPPNGFPRRRTDPRPTGNAEDMIYTPINVEIERAINGHRRPGSSQFLVEGGTVAVHYIIDGKAIGCYTMRVSLVPQVEPGSRYVFILAEALDNGGVNPLPLPRAIFAWPVDTSGSVSTIDGAMTLERLTEVVLDAAATSQPGESPAST